eukprot:473207_1
MRSSLAGQSKPKLTIETDTSREHLLTFGSSLDTTIYTPSCSAGTSPVPTVDAYGEPIGASSGVAADIINLVKCLVGAGILITPWAFSLAGLIPSIILLFFAFVCTSYSFLMACKAADITGKMIFAEIWESVYGPKYAPVSDIIIALYNYFTCTGYIILVGDFLPKVFEFFDDSFFMANRTSAILVCVVVVLLPLSLLKDMNSLRFSSALGILCIIFTFIAVGYRALTRLKTGDGSTWELAIPSWRIFTSLSIFIYSYDGHCNGAIMFHEHKAAGRNYSSFRWVVLTGMFIAFVLNISFGLLGYYMFGPLTDQNIIVGFDVSDRLILAARVAMSFTVM